jgi:hypothetical protein
VTAGVSLARDCALPCCGRSTRPPTLTDFIDRGLRRLRADRLPIVGDIRRDDGGRYARFSIRVADGLITDVAFEATTCATLVAYCEVAAESVTGLTVDAAAQRVRVRELVAALPRVPADKRHRALLVAPAVISALVESTRSCIE